MTLFVIQDCSLLIRTSGLLPAADLRELRDRIAACGGNVLFHHFFETPLRPTFDNPDYRNDLPPFWAVLFRFLRPPAQTVLFFSPLLPPPAAPPLRHPRLPKRLRRWGEVVPG